MDAGVSDCIVDVPIVAWSPLLFSFPLRLIARMAVCETPSARAERGKTSENHYEYHYSRSKKKAGHLWPADFNSFIFCGAERGT